MVSQWGGARQTHPRCQRGPLGFASWTKLSLCQAFSRNPGTLLLCFGPCHSRSSPSPPPLAPATLVPSPPTPAAPAPGRWGRAPTRLSSELSPPPRHIWGHRHQFWGSALEKGVPEDCHPPRPPSRSMMLPAFPPRPKHPERLWCSPCRRAAPGGAKPPRLGAIIPSIPP